MYETIIPIDGVDVQVACFDHKGGGAVVTVGSETGKPQTENICAFAKAARKLASKKTPLEKSVKLCQRAAEGQPRYVAITLMHVAIMAEFGNQVEALIKALKITIDERLNLLRFSVVRPRMQKNIRKHVQKGVYAYGLTRLHYKIRWDTQDVSFSLVFLKPRELPAFADVCNEIKGLVGGLSHGTSHEQLLDVALIARQYARTAFEIRGIKDQVICVQNKLYKAPVAVWATIDRMRSGDVPTTSLQDWYALAQYLCMDADNLRFRKFTVGANYDVGIVTYDRMHGNIAYSGGNRTVCRIIGEIRAGTWFHSCWCNECDLYDNLELSIWLHGCVPSKCTSDMSELVERVKADRARW